MKRLKNHGPLPIIMLYSGHGGGFRLAIQIDAATVHHDIPPKQPQHYNIVGPSG